MIGVATPLTEISEAEWQRSIVAVARQCGYLVYHTHLSKHSQPGFPDLTLVGRKVLFIEVKAERGKLSDSQVKWLDALKRAGAEAYVLRPSDLDLLGGILTERRKG